MHLVCSECGREYALSKVEYLCSKCGKNWVPGEKLQGVLELKYNKEDASLIQQNNLDISNFFPFSKESLPEIHVGNTPFYKASKMSKKHNLNIWVKNDTVNPTGSFKDRASYWIVAQANSLGVDEIVCASTGNAGSSLAGVCASSDVKAKIFIPATAPIAKRIQAYAYGSNLELVDGSYDDAYKLSTEYAIKNRVLNRNTGYNPFTIEGKKSASIEIFKQNGNRVPDWIVIPVGDGVIISAIYKGFKDLLDMGISDRIPRLIGVQSVGSNAISRYFSTGEFKSLEKCETIADSISVKTPACADLAVRALKDSNGMVIEVTDEKILEYQLLIARESGLFCEPSSAAVGIVLEKKELFNSDEQIILLLTGHGLKDINILVNKV